MLGKLIKHEFYATWKILLLLDAVLLGTGIAGFFVMASFRSIDDIGQGAIANLLVTSYVAWFLLYFLSIFAVNIGTAIFLMIRYYRNLYSTEGYLTFTLPVETPDLLHAKLVSGYVWSIAGLLLTMLSLVLMGGGFLQNLSAYDRREVLDGIGSFLSGFADAGTVVLLILSFLLTPLYGILTIYFCITVGQLWQKHKIAGAVLCYVALNIVNRIVMSSVTIGRLMTGKSGLFDDISGYYNGSLVFTLLWSCACGVVFYFVIRRINAHRVNLD